MKKNWWSSLQVKIIAWSFVPTVIILSAVAWFTFYSYQKVIGDLAIKQDREIVQSKAMQVQLAINSLLNPSMNSIIFDIDIHHEESVETRAENILEQLNLEIFDGGVYFLDQQGKVFRSWPEQPELIGQDWSDTPQFRFIQNYQGQTGAFTDLQPLGRNGEEIICSAVSMNDVQGNFLGAGYYCFTVFPVTQNAYYTELNSADLGQDVYILDGNQRIIFSMDPSEIGKDLSTEAYVQNVLQDQSMSIRYQKGTRDMVISYIPVALVASDSLRWIVLKEQSWTEIMQPSMPYRQLLLVLLSLGAIVPVLVTAYGVRHITNPIQKLIRAAEQVTAGQFKHRIEVTTGDEIETFADQFNLMSAKLDDSYSSLEKKVADRTRELATMNSIISVASRSLDLQEILGDALNKTVEQMGFDAGAAFYIQPDNISPHLVAHRGFETSAATDFVSSHAITSQSYIAEKLPEVATYEFEDTHDEKQPLHFGQPGFHLLMSVPLSTKGRTQGLFLLGRHELRRLSSEEISLLSAIGQQIGVAMENARLYEQAEQAAVAAERQRMARELHDAVTQTLFSANLIADVIPNIWKRNADEGMQNLEELRQLTRGALAEMRTMLLEMRPESLEKSDLKSLLTQLVDAFIGRVRVPVSLVIQGDCELTREVKIVFYRVAQEALNNIAKHSGARQVEVRLECQPGHLGLHIRDDGLGFEPDSLPPGHMGIAIMRERANSIGASIKIESRSGQGTTVELDWRSAGKD